MARPRNPKRDFGSGAPRSSASASPKDQGKLNTVVEQVEHGHHIFRAYYRNAFIKQYEKFSTYLRNEACSNNLSDFGLKKGLDHLAQVRNKLLEVTGRFAAFQAQWLNVHVEFPLLQRIAQSQLRFSPLTRLRQSSAFSPAARGSQWWVTA